MSMERVTVDGKTLNKRTARMLELWQFNCLTDFYVVQGSYNKGVGQSGGTHDGGGALDLSVYGFDREFINWMVKEGRLVGFADWYRTPAQGPWGAHVHGVALGDPEASPTAKAQMVSYRAGRNGLANNAPDDGPRVHPIPTFPNVKYKTVSLLVAWRQFRVKNPVARTAVKRIQWVLNEKMDAGLVVDGVAGKKTRDAYKAWEKKIKAPANDGVPGRYSLAKLGEGRFTVNRVGWENFRKPQHVQKSVQVARERSHPTFATEGDE